MVEIIFSLNQVITKIQGNLKEPFKNVIDRYIQKSNYKRDELCFIGNGEIINENNIIENIMSQDDMANWEFLDSVKGIRKKNNINKFEIIQKIEGEMYDKEKLETTFTPVINHRGG